MSNLKSFTLAFLSAGLVSHTLVAVQPETKYLPYIGTLEGTITASPLSVDCDIHEKSNRQGDAVQQCGGGTLDLSSFPTVTAGSVVSVNDNGDALNLTFVIFATGPTPTGITYQGQFTVTGGSGKYAYLNSAAPGSLGAGTSEGAADISILDSGAVLVSFAHRFKGEILKP